MKPTGLYAPTKSVTRLIEDLMESDRDLRDEAAQALRDMGKKLWMTCCKRFHP